MDLFMTLVADRVVADNVLRKVDALMDWGRVGRVLGPVRSKLGRAGYDVELMIRVLLLGQWHSLSDRALEHALRVRLDFMLFCGSSVLDTAPTTRRFAGSARRWSGGVSMRSCWPTCTGSWGGTA